MAYDCEPGMRGQHAQSRCQVHRDARPSTISAAGSPSFAAIPAQISDCRPSMGAVRACVAVPTQIFQPGQEFAGF